MQESLQRSIDQPEETSTHLQKATKLYKLRMVIKRNIVAYLFLLPALLGFGLFAVWPIINSFVIGFQYFDLINPPEWVGTKNFEFVLKNDLFYIAWRNCFAFLFWSLIPFIVPVAMAIIINELPRWGGYLRFTYYLPAILPGVVTFYLWKWLFDPSDAGLLNIILKSFGVPKQGWLDATATVIPSMSMIGIWAGTGGGMLIYLAALQSIPPHLYDAAEIDGANIWRKLWHITIPQLRIIMLYNLMFTITGAFQTFDGPFMLTGGGPVNATVTPVLLVYKYAFEQANYGAANALCLIVFIILVVLSILYLQVMRRAVGLGKF